MRFAAIVCAAALFLAGCSGGGGDESSTDEPTTTSGSSSDSSSSGTSTSTSGGSTSSTTSGTHGHEENTDPVADLVANVTLGETPLAVGFTVTATDADEGAALTWQLSFGDGTTAATGTESGSVAHTYGTVGNFTATLTVTDDDGAEATKQVDITVMVPAKPSFSGEVTTLCAVPCGLTSTANSCQSFVTDASGGDCAFFELTPSMIGMPFVATSSDAAGDVDLSFTDTCTFPADATTEVPFQAVGPEAGTVPDGMGCVVMWEFEVVPTTLTIVFG